MAVIGAIANGLWSSSSTWPGGVFPTAVDDVFANSRTVYIDQNINVLSLNTTASGAGGAASGLFYNTGSVNITTNRILPGTTSVLTLTGDNNIYIKSNLISGSQTTANAWGVIIPGSLTPPNVSISAYVSGAGGTSTSSSGGIRQEAGTLSVSGVIVGGATAGTSPGILIISVGNYPVTFTGYGRVEGPYVNGIATTSNTAGINVAYVSQEGSENSSVTFYGTVSGGSGRSTSNNQVPTAIRTTSTIPVYIYGDVIGGSGGPVAGNSTGQCAIVTDGTPTVFISGNVYSGIDGLSGTPNFDAITIGGSNAKIDIVGDLINRETLNTSGCLNMGSTTGTVNITGNIIASTGTINTARVMVITNTCSGTIYGNVSASRGAGITFGGSASLDIYGDVYGGNAPSPGAAGIAIQSSARGKLNVYGTVTPGPSSFCHGISYGNNTITTVYGKKLRGNNWGIGTAPALISQNYAVGPAQNVQSMPMFNVVCEELEFGRFGAPPVLLNVGFLDKTTNTVTLPVTSTTTETKTLIDPDLNEVMPPVSSVRLGTSYSAGNLVGTCAIPSIEEVEFGVPVDGSVGIAALTPQSVWSTSTAALTSLSATIGYRLNNAATVESVGQQVAAFGA
jgi:hypothetical protein